MLSAAGSRRPRGRKPFAGSAEPTKPCSLRSSLWSAWTCLQPELGRAGIVLREAGGLVLGIGQSGAKRARSGGGGRQGASVDGPANRKEATDKLGMKEIGKEEERTCACFSRATLCETGLGWVRQRRLVRWAVLKYGRAAQISVRDGVTRLSTVPAGLLMSHYSIRFFP